MHGQKVDILGDSVLITRHQLGLLSERVADVMAKSPIIMPTTTPDKHAFGDSLD